ncbi:HCP-like protein [Macrolepiota fuliginosa MF-IS2]|uniref:HCP-like protein n=1 Tax=Macrolepiota fuliginosa MF-IS2 TaxID=1400762 RepID=A0A9P5X7V0_9AGAR|nr:HCP-like protein [Macrolepiota fuliginosa MF-IS2]
MAAPPVPPRPIDYQEYRQDSIPPPVPPVPPDLRAQETRFSTPSPYEYPDQQPLAAPRPHRLDPSIPANMARTLDEPGFVVPAPMMHQPPPQNRTDWSPWASAYSPPQQPMAVPPPQQPMAPPPPHHHSSLPPPRVAPSPPTTSAQPSLAAPLPTITNLQGALHAVQNPQHDPFLKIAWCRDVFFLVDRAQQVPSPTTDPGVGPVVITDPLLHRIAHVAVPIVLQLASATQSPLPLYAAEAIYWRAMFAASGAYPEFVPHNLRTAFRDFETAARGGYATAWFRLGRDYENFKDTQRAKECFERGAKHGVESCTYRMGMAHLLGQLGLQANPQLAIPLLSRAATLATVHVPQPAYVYALLLLNEFTQTSVAPTAFTPFIPQGSSPLLEARKHLERAAYLHFAPAQYKLGHAYEYAQPPFPFDPLLSVQYYSLASQQGEVEADMALSKWFLCGSGDSDVNTGFEKDEVLALTFAEKAAKKGLHSAEFAMGYYAEVGVGRPKDVQSAIRWYTRARDHGNTDAADRLAALSQPSPQALSRLEHDTITDDKLVRKRTQAKQRSDAVPKPVSHVQNGHLAPGPALPSDSRTVVDVIRKQSMAEPSGPQHRPGSASPPRIQPQQSRFQQGRPVSHPVPSASGRGYSLTDSPVTSPPAGAPGPGPAPAGRPQGGRTSGVPAAGPKHQKPGPATFAEMGIQGAKAEENGCVIM